MSEGKDRKLSDPKKMEMLTSKTGGAYIPPAKLKLMQASITDKSSAPYQRIAWEALKKSIHGLINKVNTSNIAIIVRQLFKENIVRGRGLLCKSIIQAQALSLTFTHVYSALVAIINSKFPNIGELLLKRLIIQLKRGFKRNDKTVCISSATFLAHLVNQKVAHEIIALEILTLLVENPTNDSIEVAIAFLKECGMKLMEVSSKGLEAIFEMLRNILHEGKLEKRVEYMILVLFEIRKDKFKAHEAIIKELDLVDEEDQYTHIITLDEAVNGEDILNVFKFDPEFQEHEDKYKGLRKEILDESGESGSESSGDEESSEAADSDNEEEDEDKKQTILDNTETTLIALRRTIYLTINSSLDYEECAHKLMKMELKPGQEAELCNMFLDCCGQMRTYEKFYGLLAQRFCQINRIYIPPLQKMFRESYETVHRLDTNKLRNVAKFFAHLLFTDAISWDVLSCIKLSVEDTTSSSRIFIKILFQELSEYMGLEDLNERVKDPTLQMAFSGLFPRDNPKNTRFSINFFTSIGLGGLTDDLRRHLKSQPKPVVAPTLINLEESESSSDSESDTDSSDSDYDSSTDSEDSDSSPKKKSKSKKSKSSKDKKAKKKTVVSKVSKKHHKHGKSSSKKKTRNRSDLESSNNSDSDVQVDRRKKKTEKSTRKEKKASRVKKSKKAADDESSSEEGNRKNNTKKKSKKDLSAVGDKRKSTKKRHNSDESDDDEDVVEKKKRKLEDKDKLWRRKDLDVRNDRYEYGYNDDMDRRYKHTSSYRYDKENNQRQERYWDSRGSRYDSSRRY